MHFFAGINSCVTKTVVPTALIDAANAYIPCMFKIYVIDIFQMSTLMPLGMTVFVTQGFNPADSRLMTYPAALTNDLFGYVDNRGSSIHIPFPRYKSPQSRKKRSHRTEKIVSSVLFT